MQIRMPAALGYRLSLVVSAVSNATFGQAAAEETTPPPPDAAPASPPAADAEPVATPPRPAAEKREPPPPNAVEPKAFKGFAIQSEDERYELKLGGFVQADARV